jgi:hypothetical protein
MDRLHLGTLWAFAVAQPLYSVLHGSPDFFSSEAVSEIVGFTLVVGVGVPLIITLFDMVLLARASLERRASLRAPIVAGLITLMVLPLFAHSGATAAVSIAASVALGALCAWLYLRLELVRHLLTAASVGLVAFPVHFVAREPIRGLLNQPEQHSAALTVGRPTPIIVVLLDELPLVSLLDSRQMIDRFRFPQIARFASEATWFRNSTTVADVTALAVPAILTGRYPQGAATPTSREHPLNLFSWLRTVYKFHVFENWTHLCPETWCNSASSAFSWSAASATTAILYGHLVLPRSVAAQSLPPLPQRWQSHGPLDIWTTRRLSERSETDPRNLAESFMQACRPTQAASLCFVHLSLPHVPWQFLPSGRRYGPLDNAWLPDGITDTEWEKDEWQRTQAWQRHLLQVGFADTLFGKLIESLRATGWYDESLVVLVADHGLTFRGSADLRAVTRATISDVATVPLLVKFPEQKTGSISEINVQTIDLLPTIADVLQAEIPWHVDGQSVLSAGRADVDRLFRSGEAQLNLGRTPLSLDETLRLKTVLFGTGDQWEGIYAVGPLRALLGRPVASFAVAETSTVAVLESPGLYERVDVEADFIPARVKGVLRNVAEPRPIQLAVALNGRVWATTRPLVGSEDRLFTAMLPERAFRQGANQLEVFEVVGGGTALAPLNRATMAGTLSLIKTTEFEALRTPQGFIIPIRSHNLHGFLETVEFVIGDLGVKGWALDADLRPPTQFAVFSGSQFLNAGPPLVRRPDLVRKMKAPAPAIAGFASRIPLPQHVSTDPAAIRVFAIWANAVAYELVRLP